MEKRNNHSSSVWFVVYIALVIINYYGEVVQAKITGKVISCPGWRLNKYPELKKFLHNDASNYEDLYISWIRGVDPVLKLLDTTTGVETEEIKLSAYNSKSAMEELLHSKGIHLKNEEESSSSTTYTPDKDPIEVKKSFFPDMMG